MNGYRINGDVLPFAHAWPEGLDLQLVDYYAKHECPSQPQIAECERCNVRPACRPGVYAKRTCSERDSGNGTHLPPAQVESVILSVLPATIVEIRTHTGLSYHIVRRAVERLLQAHTIVQAGVTATQEHAKIYRLKG